MVRTPPQTVIIPPLENGDRLSRQEFERRYNAMTQIKKAELIEGIVYRAAALRFKNHGQPHGRMMTWLGTYAALTPGTALGDNATVRLDHDNELQPDAVLLIYPGGQCQLSDDDYIEGAPELIVEVAASSAAIDLHAKKQVYRRNGVQEYLVWQVLEQQLCWFYWQDGEYRALVPSDRGLFQSRRFPGLWLDGVALLAGNMSQVLAVVQAGAQSPAHATFVQTLGAIHQP